jgi:hypothetical protein
MLINVMLYTPEQAAYATSNTWDGPNDEAYLSPVPISAPAPYAYAGQYVTGLGVRTDPEYANIASWLLSLPIVEIDTDEAFR